MKLIKIKNHIYIHTQTIVRRKRNKIHGLHLPSGEWCTDPEILQEEAVKFFKNLFCTKDNIRRPNHNPNLRPLDQESRLALTKPVTKEEVYHALMGMKSYKAPGPDGFQPIFYKIFWDDVGDDVWQFVRQSFSYGQFVAPVVDTQMILIPKTDDPSSFKDFRPISLCNVLYKIVTKVLMNRLRPLLSDMISPLQSSFIPGRGTTDNAILL